MNFGVHFLPFLWVSDSNCSSHLSLQIAPSSGKKFKLSSTLWQKILNYIFINLNCILIINELSQTKMKKMENFIQYLLNIGMLMNCYCVHSVLTLSSMHCCAMVWFQRASSMAVDAPSPIILILETKEITFCWKLNNLKTDQILKNYMKRKKSPTLFT